MSSMSGDRGAAGGDIIPKGYSSGQLQQFTPQQMQLFQQMFGSVGKNSYLSRLSEGDEGIFNEMEAPAYRKFGQLQGQIASRFSGEGMGARRGSGFQNTLGNASTDFSERLQAQRHDLQRNATKDLFGMQQSLLGQRPYEKTLQKDAKSFLEELLISFGGGLGQSLPALAML